LLYGAQEPTASELVGAIARRGNLRGIWMAAAMNQATPEVVEVAELLGDRVSMPRLLGQVEGALG